MQYLITDKDSIICQSMMGEEEWGFLPEMLTLEEALIRANAENMGELHPDAWYKFSVKSNGKTLELKTVTAINDHTIQGFITV